MFVLAVLSHVCSIICPPVTVLCCCELSPSPLSPSADVVDGNLKSVMRIILALAAHFKPSANHRAASGIGRGLMRGTSSHNPLSPVALAQGAAAALASARQDVSQPARAPCPPRYARYKRARACPTLVWSLLSPAGHLLKKAYQRLTILFLRQQSVVPEQLGIGRGKERVCSSVGSAV